MNTQIETLKTELREFIEMSKTITQGKWQCPNTRTEVFMADSRMICICYGPEASAHGNAAFIARSRNISPAIAECLLVAVEGLESSDVYLPTADDIARYALQQIITIWEAAK